MTNERDVLLTLAEAELKDTRGLSAAGLFKWLLEPALTTATYVVLVQVALRGGEPSYALFVLCAIVPWRYFQDSVGRGLGLVASYSNVIKARRLPRGVLPLVPVLTEGATLLVGLLLVPPLMVWYGVRPTPALLYLPLVVGVLVVFVTGPCYLAAIYGVHFPDFRAPIRTLLRLGFLVSTALVSPGRIGGSSVATLFRANPLSGIFDSMRDVIIRGRAPEAWHLLYPLSVGVVLIVCGRIVYRWYEPQLAKDL